MNKEYYEFTKERAALARQIQLFPLFHGGLGNILAGVVFAAINGLAVVLHPGLLATILTWHLAAIWVVGKEIIRNRVYRIHGSPSEKRRLDIRIWHGVAVANFALLVLCRWIDDILTQRISLQELLFLLLMTAIPVILWKYCRSPHEMCIGLFLLAVCNNTYFNHQATFFQQFHYSFPVIGLLLIGLGYFEHQDFGWLAQQWEKKGNVYS